MVKSVYCARFDTAVTFSFLNWLISKFRLFPLPFPQTAAIVLEVGLIGPNMLFEVMCNSMLLL